MVSVLYPKNIIMTKKVVLNASTIRSGGAVQVAVNVLKRSLEVEDLDLYYVTNSILSELVDLPKEKTFICNSFPSNPFDRSIKKEVRKFVEDIVGADLVYSIGAPSYIGFKCKEIQRLTNPWLIEKNILAYKKLPFIDRIKLKFENYVKKTYLKNVDYFITQTADAKSKIVSNLGKKESNVYVIPNIYSYNLGKYIDVSYERNYNNQINILCISALHFHKNLDICVDVAKLFLKNGYNNIKFTFTIPQDEWKVCDIKKRIDNEGLTSYFENVGKVSLESLPELYSNSHILFMPTLLEVFSASFLEAMIFKIPIVTTDFSFNSVVCGDAALYYKDYLSADAAFDSLIAVINDEQQRNRLVQSGYNKVASMSTNEDIYNLHFNIIRNILLT